MSGRVVTLKRRGDFLRVRGGARWATPAFVIETKPRPDTEKCLSVPRFGFTVTKHIGGAVDRNRVRRRLKEAVRLSGLAMARPDQDYVVIARKAASTMEFGDLSGLLVQALEHVHRKPRRTEGPGRPPHRGERT